MEQKIVFFCGPHCSGKTSILKALRQSNFISCRGSEIGKDLFYQRRLNTASQGEEYELEVTGLELERDFSLVPVRGIVGIETWHPGNLAYAMVRNPNIVPSLIKMMRTSPFISSAYGIRFRISKETIYQRTVTFQGDRKWASDFYSQIDGVLDKCLNMLDLQERTLVLDAEDTLDNVTRKVIDSINFHMV